MSTPKHAHLAAILRARIDDGSYEGRLPSEAELMDEFGVSRTTVRAALAALLNQGLLTSASGVGYFVRQLERFLYRPQDDFRRTPINSEVDKFTLAARKRNPSQTIEVSLVHPPEPIARRLLVPQDEVVVRRKRLRLLDGMPYQINDSYYPRDVVDGTEAMVPGDVSRGVNEVLAENGFAQVRALDEIWVRMPTPEEADRLTLGPGTPVGVHMITGFTADDRPIRVVRTILPGDRNIITFDRTHPDHEDGDR